MRPSFFLLPLYIALAFYLFKAALTYYHSNFNSMSANSIKFIPRLSQHRGHADHSWLKTFHTFSFASHHDPEHTSYGPLRVINEDRVDAKTGFGTHSHREFEIFSYVVSGQLEHKDSMGNTEVLSRGDIQMTSAGTGISHSEHAHGSIPVHFLQIWAFPHTRGLKPNYYTRHFPDSAKQNQWARVVAPVGAEGVDKKREVDGPSPAPVHSELTMYASLLDQGFKSSPLGVKGKKGYVHVVMKSGYNVGPAEGAAVKFASGSEEVTLKEGDGAYLHIPESPNDLVVENVGDQVAEVLVFDME